MFECLRQSILANKSLSVDVCRCVYLSTVAATWSETWAVKVDQTRRIEVFHNHCVRGMLGVSQYQQWRERVCSEQLAVEFGMTDGVGVLLVQHRLRWFGHLATMGDDHLPKQMLFGELLTTRPFHGPKLQWRDVVSEDTLSWYEVAIDCSRWHDLC